MTTKSELSSRRTMNPVISASLRLWAVLCSSLCGSLRWWVVGYGLGPYPTTRCIGSVRRPICRPSGSLGDPDVLPGRHTEGVVVEVALDPGSVGLGDPAVEEREQGEVLLGDLLVEVVPGSTLLGQRQRLDRDHLGVHGLVAERGQVVAQGVGLVRVGRPVQGR